MSGVTKAQRELSRAAKKRGRPPGTPGNRTRYTGPARSASPTVRALFDVIDRHKLSVKHDVAPGLRISNVSLSNYRHGKNTPSILAIEEIAAVLGMRIVVTPVSSVSSTDAGLPADDRAE